MIRSVSSLPMRRAISSTEMGRSGSPSGAFVEGVKIGSGIIIADTKMEFGLAGGELILIDEVLTPDSSRFWPRDDYAEGRGQKSYDKQFLRDYLLSLQWDQKPPAPQLPPDIIERTRQKYEEALRRFTKRP